MKSLTFKAAQTEAQTRYFQRFDPQTLMPDYPYRFGAQHRRLNLNPAFAEQIERHFAGDGRDGIVWHQHRNHALSSQVCCVNFLAPLMRQPDVLSHILASALGIAPPEMCPVGADAEGDIFVDFEWTGAQDYLGEWPVGQRAARGANATSADAVLKYVTPTGPCTVLIEWKYTEAYGAPIPDSQNPEGGNRTRTRRYQDIAFAPAGPIRGDLGLTVAEFFWEPFYQMLRQQMLAWQMQRARENGAARVIVLHLSPAGNRALHKVTAPALQRFGTDAFQVFSHLLTDPTSFRRTSIEAAFLPALRRTAANEACSAWSTYLLDRYTFLQDPHP